MCCSSTCVDNVTVMHPYCPVFPKLLGNGSTNPTYFVTGHHQSQAATVMHKLHKTLRFAQAILNLFIYFLAYQFHIL